MRALIWSQGLLGSGHLRRTAHIARALADAGIETHLAYGGIGGAPPPGVGWIELPRCRSADAGFATIVDEAGAPIDDAWRAARRDALLAAHDRLRPDAVITELFPFGRRAFRFELLPLLARMAESWPRPLAIASVRDVLVERSKPARDAESLDLALAHYHAIWAHADRAFVELSESFPLADRLAHKLLYTGYVVEPPPRGEKKLRVVVSAGGGAVGDELIDRAIGAWRRGAGRPSGGRALEWIVVTGPAIDAERLEQLRRENPGLAIERKRDDLAALIARSSVSVSQAGYNTVIEAIAGETPMLLAPFGEGRESEQRRRAEAARRSGCARLISPPSESAIAAGLDWALSGAPRFPALDLSGARTSARALREMLDRRKARR